MTLLHYAERPAAGEPEGLVLLHHGRGADELDLLTLADVLDPDRRLHIVTPRAPLQLPGSPGYHWYLVPRVGHPDPESFKAAHQALSELHDELAQRTGVDAARTVLGGFSMGCVMSYALGLDVTRSLPAGILAFSGFIPTVSAWQPDLQSRRGLPVFIAHGSRDAVISVDFGRAAAQRLRDGGLSVDYHESEASHHIDPRELPAAAEWLERTIPQKQTL